VIARVLQVEVEPGRVDAVVETYRELVRPIHERAAGLLRHYVLADQASGRIVIVGIWDSAASVAAIRDVLEPARQRLWDTFGKAPELAVFEVADTLPAE
jgi:quinol monooxygenase YgiN